MSHCRFLLSRNFLNLGRLLEVAPQLETLNLSFVPMDKYEEVHL